MHQLDRRESILAILKEKGQISVEELSLRLGTSKVTIRSDLSQLEQKGLLSRYHGGAVLPEKKSLIMPQSIRARAINSSEKARIGRIAASLVRNGDFIAVNEGSTLFEVVSAITAENVTVVTNDLGIVMRAVSLPNLRVRLTGGDVDTTYLSLIGYEAQAYFDNVHVDKCFIGSEGFGVNFGVSYPTRAEISVKLAMMNCASQCILVSDHTKLNRMSKVRMCGLERFHTIVTDSISPSDREKIEALGPEVITRIP